jgi:subtilisin family serine protease
MWGVYSDDSPVAVGPAPTTNQYGTQAEEAWNNGFIGSSDIYIGVIDEGIQYTHPDLIDNIWDNPFDPIDGVDNDGNGKIDDTQGWDFYSNNRTVYDGTSDDHGTHVAGTIGATGGNGSGVVGINWDVTLISTKFLGAGGGTTSAAIQALDYLTDLKTRHGLNIVATNNSWGGGGFSQGLLDAITRAANQDILFIAAAGNSGSNNDSSAFYPATYDTTAGAGYDAVISVASITNTGARSSFSSYGATTVDLGAPGSTIASTVPTNAYAYYSGTSMSTPHVTGAVALYAAANPGLSALDIRNAVLNSTTPTPSLAGITVTGGRLNVSALLGTPTPLPSLSIGDVTVTEGNSGSTIANFVVTLSAASTNPVTFDFATANGSATSGSDFGGGSGSLEIAAGQTSVNVSIPVFGDTDIEGDETFTVLLSNPSFATIDDGSGLGTILNDDFAAPLTVSINDVQKLEANKGVHGFTFIVSLSTAAAVQVRVNYATADGSATVADIDYYARSGVVTFNPGQTSKTVVIQAKGDRKIESDEVFFVNLSAPTGGASIDDGQGVGTIVNDDGAAATSFAFTSEAFSSSSVSTVALAFDEIRQTVSPQGSSKAIEVLAEVKTKVNSAAYPGIERAQLAVAGDGGAEAFGWAVDLSE